MRKIDKIILHCSASDIRSYDFNAIRLDHLNRGWDDIGYHFGIDYDGDVHFLRPVDVVGAHVKGHNSGSIGICVLGLNSFRWFQLEQCAKLCSTLMKLLGLDMKSIRAHYEFTDKKTCPNFDIEWFKNKYLKVANGI